MSLVLLLEWVTLGVVVVTLLHNVVGVIQCLIVPHLCCHGDIFAKCLLIQCLSESHLGHVGYSVAQCSWCDSVLEWVARGSRWLLGCSMFLVWFNAWVSHTWVAVVTRLLSVLGVIQCLSESHVGCDDYSVVQCSWCDSMLEWVTLGHVGYSVAQCSWCDSVLEWVARGSRWLLGCSVFSVWFSAWVSHMWVAMIFRLLSVLGVSQCLSESYVGCHS